MKYTTLIGHVQSGKTHEEINFCYRSISENIPVIFITRNIISDQLQLQERILLYKEKLNVQLLRNISIDDGVSFLNSVGILILLCNSNQLNKAQCVLNKYNGIYNVCIDEVDFSLKTSDNSSKTDQILNTIKHGSNRVLGATATPFAIFSTDSALTKCRYIKPGKTYRGINSLQVKFVPPNVQSDTEIYTSLLTKERAVLLHTVSKKKSDHTTLLNNISSEWNTFTVLTYNGDGIQMICKNRPLIPFTKARSSNQYGQVILKYFYLNGVHHFHNWSISNVLQLLVDDPHHNHTHISIISGHLASRGISFVSSDFTLHLTDQYFHPGKKTHGENFIQSLRILGCYKDTTQLSLWCTEHTWKCILQHHKIINDVVHGIDNSTEWITKIQEINLEKPDTPLCRPQFTRKNVFTKINAYYNFKLK